MVRHTLALHSVISVYASPPGFVNSREFIEVELANPLISGKKYNVEFYVSLVDSVWYATNSLAACLTANGIGDNLDTIFALTPQIQNSDSVFLVEKNKWMQISGSFYSEGTEKYIAIGNFRNDQNTNTLNVYQGQDGWWQAAYYLDDVSVTLDTTTGIAETEPQSLKIFPNPATTQITIRFNQPIQAQTIMEITDMQGRLVTLSIVKEQQSTIPLSLTKGLYLLQVKEKGEGVYNEKLVIE